MHLKGITYSKSLPSSPHNLAGPGTMSASMQPDDGSKSISTTKPNMQQSVSFITVFPLSSHRRSIIPG